MTELFIGLAATEAALADIFMAALFVFVQVASAQFTHRAYAVLLGRSSLYVFGLIAFLTFYAAVFGAIQAQYPERAFRIGISIPQSQSKQVGGQLAWQQQWLQQRLP